MPTLRPQGVARWLPIVGWLPRYRRSALSGDAFGALTAWAIVVPESVAYAQIAGVPPQYAFYAAPVALVIYAIFGSSRSLIVGATSAASILSASTVAAISVSPQDAIELSAALAVVAGVILLVAGVLKLGFITNFLAEPALYGFLFGMALVIVVRQAGKLVGVSTGDGDFFARVVHLLKQVDDWSVTTMVVGAMALIMLVALERWAPRVPASLVVLALGIIFSAALSFDQHGIAIVGKIPSSVPSPHVPDVSWHQVAGLLGGGFGLALVVFAESYSISSRFARTKNYEVDANQEMIGMGASNAVVGFFHGFAVSGSASRTAAVDAAGGGTQMVSLFAAVLVLVTAAWLTPLFTDLPEPVLGAIVIVAVRGFLRVGPLQEYWRRDRASFAVAMAALGGVLVFDLLPGLLIAVGLSLVLFIAFASSPRLAELHRTSRGEWVEADPDPAVALESLPGLLVVRPDGALFFGNASRIRHGVEDLVAAASAPPQVVCLVLHATFRFEIAVLDTLRELEEDLSRQGVQLWFAGVTSAARPALDADELGARMATGRIWHSVRAAADHFTADGVVSSDQ